MGVSFGNPLLAWGALFAALPILVHLLQRRRPRPHPFAALELVLRSQRQNVRRLRLRRLLLLAARTALLLFLPLALARPHFATEAAAAAAPRGPAATAIVLDTSMSMGWRDGKRAILDKAKEDARKVLADLLSEEPVTVVRCGGGVPEAAAPSFDRVQARREIDEAEATFLLADLSACVQAAATALGESPVPGKKIFVATDLTAASWQLDAPPPTVPTAAGEVAPEVVILDAARGKELPNLAITDLRIEAAPEIGPRGKAFTITVRNFGEEAVAHLPTELEVGGEVVAKGFVDVPALGAATKRLLHRFPGGGTFAGSARIEGDALEADDARSFVAHVQRDVRVLLVNGAPSSVRYRDEAFFVETALRAGGHAPISLQVVDADDLRGGELEDVDLLFLLNVRAPSREVAARWEAFVRGGGGIFLALGDQVEAEAYNERLGRILPLPLHLPKTAAEAGDEEKRGARFSGLALDHPALRVFSGVGIEGFSAARTSRYFLLQPGEEARVLASFDDGAPALVEREIGAGRVMLFASTADRDWSDWAIQTSFLPAMQQIASHLSRSLDERKETSAQVGSEHGIPAAEVARVEAPDRKELPFTSGEDGVRVKVERPGIHRVWTDGEGGARERPELAFASWLDPEASDTRRLDPDELRALFGAGNARVQASPDAKRGRDTPLWSLFLLLGVAAFFVEGALLRR